MQTQFTPIAMRCTRAQFDAIKPKLQKAQYKIGHEMIVNFDIDPYLINNYTGKPLVINVSTLAASARDRQVYETWDEDVFLQACGIEVDQYTVLKDFILDAHKDACPTWKKKIEEQFPKLFVKPQFEIGKWYANMYGATWLYQGHDVPTYGFTTNGCYDDNVSVSWDDRLTLADSQRVEDLLKQHALQLGIKKGVTVIRTPQMLDDARTSGATLEVEICSDTVSFDQYLNILIIDGRTVFAKGQWAKVVQVTKYTVAQLENMLGHKIEIVSEK